jgi:hypothetical protein
MFLKKSPIDEKEKQWEEDESIELSCFPEIYRSIDTFFARVW